MKLASFFIGFALRLLAYCCADYIDIISDVIVGPSSSSTDFLEELFLLQFKTNSNGTISNILSLLDSSGINRISCFFIAILVQIMSCLLFSHPNSKKQRNDELSVWLLYWNHPLMIVSSVLSPMVSIRHCLLLVCYINACNGCIPLVAISLFLLCYCQANYCLIIPGVMFLCWRGVYPFYLKCLADISPLSPTAPYLLVFSWCVVATFTCTIVLFGILLIVQLYGLVNSLSFGYFEAVVVTVSEHIDINSLPMLLQDIANLLIPFYQSFPCYEVRLITSPVHPTFQPSVGILWYLHAQLFPTYQDYFQCLWAYQPVAIVLALLSRFGGILDKEMVLSTLFVVIFYSQSSSYADILFIGLLLLRQCFSTVLNMSYLPWTVFIFHLSMMAHPIVFYQWTVVGTANANYLFFSGLVCWVFFAVSIIDLLSTMTKEVDAMECIEGKRYS